MRAIRVFLCGVCLLASTAVQAQYYEDQMEPEELNIVDIDELRISEIQVNQGPTMKRLRARARGRADRIFKRTSHLTVTVAEQVE